MEWPFLSSQLTALQLTALALAGFVGVDVIRRFIRGCNEKSGISLPPGPAPLPLLGSALSINAQEPWLTYTAWRKKYGDVIYVRLLDTDVVILNSPLDAVALLDKRSQIYSDRPFIATVQPYGHGISFSFSQYGPYWRLCRRIFHQTFRAESAVAFRPMQLRRARQMVINIIDDANEYPFHFATFSAAVAMSAVYDYEPHHRGDPMVAIADDFGKASFSALTPERALLLKTFPFLLSVPEWVPWLSRIRREASDAYGLSIKLIETPYQWAQRRMEAKEGVAADTMIFNHIQRMEKLDVSERAAYETALKSASSTAFLGSAETTTGTLMTFTLAMVKHPHVWKRAHAEIDAVVGSDRLPEYADRPSLPYVDAIIRETMRWQPIVPLVPHAVITSDVYKGHYIPGGANIIANVWAMSRDESRYPNPEVFVPERFLNSDGLLNSDNPTSFVFGFGRRICPGRHTADASVWSSVVTMLALLDFNAVKDTSGNDIKFEAKFANGISRHPEFFPCNLAPRAHVTREMLQQFLEKC